MPQRIFRENLKGLPQANRVAALLAVLLAAVLRKDAFIKVKITHLVKDEGFEDESATNLQDAKKWLVKQNVIRENEIGELAWGVVSDLFYSGREDLTFLAGFTIFPRTEFAPLELAPCLTGGSRIELSQNELIVGAACFRLAHGSTFTQEGKKLERECSMSTEWVDKALLGLVEFGVIKPEAEENQYELGCSQVICATGPHEIAPGWIVVKKQRIDLRQPPSQANPKAGVLRLKFASSMIALELWRQTNDTEGRRPKPAQIGQPLGIKAENVESVVEPLVKNGFVERDRRGTFLHGHGQFKPDLGRYSLKSITTQEGFVLQHGVLCDLKKQQNGQAIADANTPTKIVVVVTGGPEEAVGFVRSLGVSNPTVIIENGE